MIVVKVELSQYVRRRDNLQAVVIAVTLHRKKVVRINTGVMVEARHWKEDAASAYVVGRKDARDLNLIIEKCRSVIDGILIKYRLSGKELNADTLHREYANPGRSQDFFVYAAEYINSAVGLSSPNTTASQWSCINKLKEFRQTITFRDIDEGFFNDFKKFLKRKKGNNPNTIHKTLTWIKAILNAAVRDKIIDENPAARVRQQKMAVDRQWLTRDEVRKIYDHYTRGMFSDRLQRTCRYFLFSCFTGLRLSDVKRLMASDIMGDTIVIRPAKSKNTTGEIVKIPMLSHARHLIGDLPAGNQPIFNTYTDQVTSRYVKELVSGVGIEKEITFHCARHTFASLYLYYNPGNIAVLQKLMGHANIEQTMVYVHVNEDMKRESINRMESVV